MSQTLSIGFKATGERFDVSYRRQTTIRQLIEYVCRHSTAISNSNPNDYYMAIDNSDTLDDHRTVEETALDQPNRFDSLNVCIKTGVLMDRILRSHTQLWQMPAKGASQKTQPVSTTEKGRNIGMKQKSSLNFGILFCFYFIEKASTVSGQKQVTTSIAAISNDGDANSEVHILVCGGPKVGKSSLINALCGCPVAKTNAIGLDRCTQKTSYYQLDNIYFWDTPGIQQWSHLDIDSYLNSSRRNQTPICMFYCASPGSFVKLKQLEILLDQCIRRRHIFCVLVVTNMFVSVQRHAILEEFKVLLSKYVDHKEQIKEKRGLWYYGKVGLCTMINSQEYLDEDTNRRQPPQGVNELVLALTKSFSETHQLGPWLRTIEQNRQFWLDKQEELYQLTQKPPGTCLSEMT